MEADRSAIKQEFYLLGQYPDVIQSEPCRFPGGTLQGRLGQDRGAHMRLLDKALRLHS